MLSPSCAACCDHSNSRSRCHVLYLALLRVVVKTMPSSRHNAFVGNGSSVQLGRHIANALVLPHVLDFCREEARQRLAELAVLVGAGSEGEGPGQLAHKFIAAVRDLRTDVDIPDHSDLIRREELPHPHYIDSQAVGTPGYSGC